MAVIIELEDVKINYEGETLPSINLRVEEGEIVAIETERDLYDRALNDFFVCENLDFSGNANIFGINLSKTDNLSIQEIRKNLSLISLAYPLVSNLKLIENVYLTYLFHSDEPEKKIFEKAYRIIDSLGIANKFNLNPAFLTNFEKKLALLARTFMVNYKVLILSRFFSDLDDSKKQFLVDKILEQKKLNDKIAVIIIERNIKLLPMIDFDKIIKV
ncbi:MAG: hypothetical protein N2999_06825 [Proteobacteria bacterium]|nr:hypothetical protein [Pseudomonadota bacterium]